MVGSLSLPRPVRDFFRHVYKWELPSPKYVLADLGISLMRRPLRMIWAVEPVAKSWQAASPETVGYDIVPRGCFFIPHTVSVYNSNAGNTCTKLAYMSSESLLDPVVLGSKSESSGQDFMRCIDLADAMLIGLDELYIYVVGAADGNTDFQVQCNGEVIPSGVAKNKDDKYCESLEW